LNGQGNLNIHTQMSWNFWNKLLKQSGVNPSSPRGPKVSSNSFNFSSKCCNFYIRCPNSIKFIEEFPLSLLVYAVKFSNQSKIQKFLGSQSKFIGSIWVHQTAFEGCNFGGFYLQPMFVFNKIYWVMFPLKSSYCGKFFMSIQDVLNIWEKFKGSKSRHFWNFVNFSSLFLLHTLLVSNNLFWESCAY